MKKILATLAISLAMASAPASAYIFGSGIVLDPTNLVQNLAQAKSGILTEINTAKQLIQQTKAAIDMAKSVKGLKDVHGLSDLDMALRLYRELKKVDDLIEKDYEDAAQLNEQLTSRYGASDASWAEFITARDKINQKQRENAAKRYTAINTSLEQNARQRQAIVSQLGTVQGQTEAMQTVGAAIDVLIGQNQQLISMMATNNMVLETKAAVTNAEEQNATNKHNAHQQRLREAAAKYAQ